MSTVTISESEKEARADKKSNQPQIGDMNKAGGPSVKTTVRPDPSADIRITGASCCITYYQLSRFRIAWAGRRDSGAAPALTRDRAVPAGLV